MSGIIHALFGHQKNKDNKIDKSISSSSNVVDDIHVYSVVSSESHGNVTMQNSKKMTDLLNKLGTTHNQIDEYSKKRTDQINDAVASSIKKVVTETKFQQEKLLTDANQRSTTIETEYKQRLQERIVQLNTEKAVLLAELERNLNERQEAILVKAKENIDAVQNAANQEKFMIFKEAQVKANEQVDQITEKVAELAAEDAQRRLQSTTQTIITTKSIASGETHTGDVPNITINKSSQIHSPHSSTTKK